MFSRSCALGFRNPSLNFRTFEQFRVAEGITRKWWLHFLSFRVPFFSVYFEYILWIQSFDVLRKKRESVIRTYTFHLFSSFFKGFFLRFTTFLTTSQLEEPDTESWFQISDFQRKNETLFLQKFSQKRFLVLACARRPPANRLQSTYG